LSAKKNTSAVAPRLDSPREVGRDAPKEKRNGRAAVSDFEAFPIS
jgi:hypothetical protein